MKAGNTEYKKALSLAQKRSPDLHEVKRLLDRAIAKENVEAMYALATWYLHGKHVGRDFSKAVKLLIPSAKSLANASLDLAICYERGNGTKKNLKKAFSHYTNAALLGNARSHYEVGRCCFYAIGTKKDLEVAEVWFRSADRLGYDDNEEPAPQKSRVRKVRKK